MKKFIFTVVALVSAAVTSPSQGSCILPDDANFASLNGGCEDLTTGIVWSVSISAATTYTTTYAGAKNYCLNLVEGGYSDWVSPTINQLLTVISHGAANYLDSDSIYFSQWSGTPQGKKTAYGAFTLLSTTSTLFTVNSSIDGFCVR